MGESTSCTAAALLGAVESLPEHGAGAFILSASDGRPIGVLFAEGNRVCWAVSGGRGHRLRELLGGASLDDAALAHALRRHTVESLIKLDGEVYAATWIAHRGQGYRPRCRFTPAELLAAMGAELYAREAEGANELDEILPRGATGASFAIGDAGEAVPVREVGGERLGLAMLHEVGAWAVAALDVTRGFSPVVMQRVMSAIRGRAALAWRPRHRLIHTMVLDERSALVQAVAELERRGHPAVLSTGMFSAVGVPP